MGAIEHQDVQVDENGENPIRELIREVNRQLRRIAQIATNNFRNPIAIPVSTARSGALWAPRERYDVLSFDVYAFGGATISDITDGGVTIPTTPSVPIAVAADTHTNIACDAPYRVDAGQDVSFVFSAAPAGEDLVAGINVRRLG